MKLMKVFYYLVILWLMWFTMRIVFSCSPQYHVERAAHHKDKAISKGAVFTPDTVKIDGDTITISYFKNDTLFIEREIVRTVTLDGEVRYITKHDKRIEKREKRRFARRLHKQTLKTIKQDAKTERTDIRRSKRNLWYVWLIIGIVVGLFIPTAKKYIARFV